MKGGNLMEEAMFEHLFQKYKDMIYRVAFLYLKNEADALDIVQNTFIKLLKRTDRYTGRSSGCSKR